MIQNRIATKEIVYTFPFCLLIVELVIGMYFNDVLPSVFSFTDELFAVLLLLWTLKYAVFVKKQPFEKEVMVFTFIVIFYFLYSIYIHSNVFPAICGDLLIQLKPFIAYFMFGYIAFRLNNKQKDILRRICLFLFAISASVAVFAVLSGRMMDTLYYVYGHATRYGTTLILLALTYLFCSDYTQKKHLLVFFIILTFSLFSMRSKIYGFYTIALFLVFILRGNIEIKLSIKNIIIFSLIGFLALYVAREKIFFYFIDIDIENEYALARPSLYVTSWQLLFDYFPFGTGLASFATHYSGVYYSNIYELYELNGIWGLLEEDPIFVSDTQYPALAQFGVVGIILFVTFWVRIVRKANSFKKLSIENNQSYLIIILLILFLLIESVGDAVFTGNRGFYSMILLSLCFNSFKDVTNENINNLT